MCVCDGLLLSFSCAGVGSVFLELHHVSYTTLSKALTVSFTACPGTGNCEAANIGPRMRVLASLDVKYMDGSLETGSMESGLLELKLSDAEYGDASAGAGTHARVNPRNLSGFTVIISHGSMRWERATLVSK